MGEPIFANVDEPMARLLLRRGYLLPIASFFSPGETLHRLARFGIVEEEPFLYVRVLMNGMPTFETFGVMKWRCI